MDMGSRTTLGVDWGHSITDRVTLGKPFPVSKLPEALGKTWSPVSFPPWVTREAGKVWRQPHKGPRIVPQPSFSAWGREAQADLMNGRMSEPKNEL